MKTKQNKTKQKQKTPEKNNNQAFEKGKTKKRQCLTFHITL
jgi:hypothetical protein